MVKPVNIRLVYKSGDCTTFTNVITTLFDSCYSIETYSIETTDLKRILIPIWNIAIVEETLYME